MRWKVHGRRTMYESDWVNVYLDDVELPDGTHIDHHVLTMPKASQTAIVLSEARDQVLLIWRHRFITDKWGWEVPAGWVEPHERRADAIRREILEETGYTVGAVQLILEYDAIPGLSTMHFTCWVAYDANRSTEPDGLETAVAEWHSLHDIENLLDSGAVQDGPSLTALSFYLSRTRKSDGV